MNLAEKQAPAYQHFLLTRFNVRIKPGHPLASDAWHRHRLVYFESICIPSVRAQSCDNFTWVVFCDDQSADWFRNRIEDLAAEHHFEVAYCAGPFTPEYVAEYIGPRCHADWLVTSRVDNDDAVSDSFIERVQSYVFEEREQFINFTRGLQATDDGKIYHRADPSNAFVSFIEPRVDPLPKTVFVDWHTRIHKYAFVREISGPPMWLQMVHGQNIANEVHGIRASPKLLSENFSHVRLDSKHISRIALVMDQSYSAMKLTVRVLRDRDRILWMIRVVRSSVFASRNKLGRASLNSVNLEPRASESGKTIPVAGIPFRVCSLAEAASNTIRDAQLRKPIGIRLANAYCVALSDTDDSYRTVLLDGVNYPDGASVVSVMRSQVGSDAGRVRGPSFFEAVFSAGRSADLRHFLLGTTDETLALVEKRAIERFPGIQIVGTHSPPFAPVEMMKIDDIAAVVNDSGADIIWVALGTPKQDFVAQELSRLVSRPCVGVGAAFDFFSGDVATAPIWVQNSGFEWLFRLTQEPKRLWRRYLFGNLKFISLTARPMCIALIRRVAISSGSSTFGSSSEDTVERRRVS